MKEREQDQAEIKSRLAPSDSSHWYNQKAEACHEIEMKTKPGEFRAVNKTDAKKLNLLPSVTNIMSRCENKVGLDDWKRNQIFDAIRNPEVLEKMLACHNDDLRFNAICKELDEKARAKSKEAADLGSKFHHLAELLTEIVQPGRDVMIARTGLAERQFDRCLRMFNESFVAELRSLTDKGVILRNERSIVWNELVEEQEYGVGGRIDLLATVPAEVARHLRSLSLILSHCPGTSEMVNDRIRRGLDINILIDWKTRKPNRGKKNPEMPTFPIYPSDPAQLSAYASGVKRAMLLPVNLCISLIVPSDYINADDEGSPVPFSKPVHRIFPPRIMDESLKYFHSCISHWRHEEGIMGGDFAPVVIEE